MYFATRDLLKAWKARKGCEFDQAKNRPGLKNRPSQPAEGTQRVWISSQQLYGKKHCNVQQVIPMEKFGALTLLHLPNKNYRRVGRKGRMGGPKHEDKDNNVVEDTTPVAIEGPSKDLLTALQLHLEIRKRWPAKPQHPYKGIQMEDHAKGKSPHTLLFIRRMDEYHDYVSRGGTLSEEDMTKTDL
jgi:hypothetical protein